MTNLVLYTPQKLRPAVKDIMVAIAEDYDEIDKVVEWHRGIDPSLPVLCFHEIPAETPLNYVKTMSQKQVLAKASAVTELKAALDLLYKPRKLRRFTYEIWDTYAHDGKMPEMGDVVVVDIETGGDIKTWIPEEMWLLSVALYDGKKLIVLSEEWLSNQRNRNILIRFLHKSGRKLVAHNMKFDFRSLSAQLGERFYGHMDTQLLHHAINPGAGEHGLKPLAAKYLGAPDWDATSSKYVKGYYTEYPGGTYPEETYDKYVEKFGRVKVGFEAIPRDILYEYNAWDVYWTWHLMEYLVELSDDRVRRVALHEYRMGNYFQDIENYGMAVDLEHLEALAREFNQEKEQYMEKLAKLVSPDFNPNSPKQVKEVFQSAGISLDSTAEEVLVDLKATNLHPTVEEFIDTLLAVRGVNKNLGTYNEGIKKRLHDGRVYPNYKVHGTNTGRLSSADPNIQNIPRDPKLRKLFTVRDTEEFDFLEVDYSQAELRVMAVLSDDAYLISLFQDGMPDFFNSLLPVTYPHHDIESWTKDEHKERRANLKGVIYGLSYGRKAPAIAHALGIATSEAKAIISNYFQAAPDFYQWRQNVEYQAVASDGVLETVFGRRFQSEIVTGRSRTNVVNSALSFLPQSTASDICVSAAMEIHKWIGPDYGGRLIASIHDANLAETPKKYTKEIAARMQEEMRNAAIRALGTTVPFATSAEWGTSWGTTAEPNS